MSPTLLRSDDRSTHGPHPLVSLQVSGLAATVARERCSSVSVSVAADRCCSVNGLEISATLKLLKGAVPNEPRACARAHLWLLRCIRFIVSKSLSRLRDKQKRAATLCETSCNAEPTSEASCFDRCGTRARDRSASVPDSVPVNLAYGISTLPACGTLERRERRFANEPRTCARACLWLLRSNGSTAPISIKTLMYIGPLLGTLRNAAGCPKLGRFGDADRSIAAIAGELADSDAEADREAEQLELFAPPPRPRPARRRHYRTAGTASHWPRSEFKYPGLLQWPVSALWRQRSPSKVAEANVFDLTAMLGCSPSETHQDSGCRRSGWRPYVAARITPEIIDDRPVIHLHFRGGDSELGAAGAGDHAVHVLHPADYVPVEWRRRRNRPLTSTPDQRVRDGAMLCPTNNPTLLAADRVRISSAVATPLQQGKAAVAARGGTAGADWAVGRRARLRGGPSMSVTGGTPGFRPLAMSAPPSVCF